MNRRSYMCLLDMISDHHVFDNNSPYPQAEVFVQLAVALDRFGHEGNGHEIAWPDRQEQAVNSALAELGFPGCIGLVDGTLVKLSQRPRDDGETYFDRKSNYSMNVQDICDQHKRVIYFFAGMPGTCHDLTCLRRSSLWGCLGSALLFDNGQYLLGDSGYIPLDCLVCSYKRTNGDMNKRDEWSEDDHPIEEEREDDLGPPPQGARECNRRESPLRICQSRLVSVCVLRAVCAIGGLFFRNIIAIMAAQAGAPLHFDLYTKEDDMNYIKWKRILKKEAHRILCGIDARMLKRFGLHDALWMD
ncbi:hypothetical protein R1sor_017451 [Riccia sorocarpa]|uniref:DDE Tnp4 domain-containing protein n=1 Tax=Riccia sorocarpa TaxID=122646 RepID=A0ABD3I8P2_9MARC